MEESIDSNNVSRIIEKIEIYKGNGTLQIIQTNNGLALNITLSKSIHLIGKKRINGVEDKNWDYYFFNKLSMNVIENNTKERPIYFVYSSENNVTVKKFKCYWENVSELDIDRSFNRELNNIKLVDGWQLIEFEK